ncbi:MAG: DUF4175 family protein [Elusimicrobiota bacterium]
MKKILTKTIQHWKKLLILEGMAKWLAVTLFLLVVISVFNYFIPVPLSLQIIISAANFLFLSSAFWVWIVCPLLNPITIEQMALLIPEKFPAYQDGIINALQLARLKEKNSQKISLDLIEKYLEEIDRKIKNFSPADIGEQKYLKRQTIFLITSLALFLILYLAPPQIIKKCLLKTVAPWRGSHNELVFLQPKNSKLLWGQPLTIRAKFVNPNIFPVLKYRSKNNEGQKLAAKRDKENELLFGFSSVKESFDYYLLWPGNQTPSYRIEIVRLPEVGDIYLKYIFPAYTNLPAQVIERSNGDIQALLGTRILIEAAANHNLRKAVLSLSDGQQIVLKIIGNKVRGEFTLLTKGEYWIDLEDENKIANPEPPHHLLEPTGDQLPEINLLSPGEDLVVSEKAALPITYSIGDDFGVTKVELIYRTIKEEKSALIKEFNPPLSGSLDDYKWDLSVLALSPGEKLSYYLQVWDNDTVGGPKTARTPALSLEVFSYENEHAYIEQDLKNLQEKLFALLEKQTTVKQALEKTGDTSLAWAAEEQKEIKKRTEAITGDLAKTLSRMKSDPLSTQKTVWEYQGIKDNLAGLISREMSEAIENFQNQQAASGKESQKQIIKELERISLLAEDINQYQKMEDIFNKLRDLMDKQNSFQQELENLKDLADQKKLDKMIKALDELSKQMEQLNKLLSQFPQELPEEFVNQPAVKEVNLGEMSDLLEQIKSAIAKGDIKQAMELLKKLSEQLAKTLANLEAAAAEVPLIEEKKFNTEIAEWQKRWESLIDQESLLLNRTAEMEKEQLDKIYQEQKKLLEELAKVQKTVQEGFYQLRFRINQLNPGFDLFDTLENTDFLIEKVYQEFVQGQVVEAPAKLSEIINNLEALRVFVDNKQSEKPEKELTALSKELGKTKKTEEEILEKLNPKAQKLNLSETDQEKLKKLAQDQMEIQKNTESLEKRIEGFSRKTATIDPKLRESLKKAGHSMGEAKDYLEQENIGQGGDKEREALQYLSQGKEALQSMSGEMQSREGGGRKMQASMIQGKGAGGRSGVREGYVPLPSAEQYKVPKEYRQEILESLKEKYPKVYEKIIKEYYKKLSE